MKNNVVHCIVSHNYYKTFRKHITQNITRFLLLTLICESKEVKTVLNKILKFKYNGYVSGLIFLSPLEINTAICRFGWMAATCRTASVGPLICRWQYLHLAVFSCKNIYRHTICDIANAIVTKTVTFEK